jgi:hypothetical protein
MRGRNNQLLLDSNAQEASVSVGAMPQTVQNAGSGSSFGGHGTPASAGVPAGEVPQQQYPFYPYPYPPYPYFPMGMQVEPMMDSVTDDQVFLTQRLPLLVRLARRARGLTALTLSQKNEIATQAAIGLTGMDSGPDFESARNFAREWLRQNVK